MPQFLSPIGNSQIMDANGNPLVGGFLETYLAGTSTPRTTFTTQAGTVPQGAVMTLNSLGYPVNGAVWMVNGVALKFVVKNALGVVQSTFDNVSGIGDVNTAPDEWAVYAAVPTYVSPTVFTVVNDQTNTFRALRKLKSTNTGGTVYSAVVSSVFAASATTVTVVNSVGALDAGLSAVSYGLLAPNNPSIPEGAFGATLRTAATQAIARTALAIVDPVTTPTIRQTVLSGPVDVTGQSAFGGATGATTVTATGTLVVTAANGILNRTGSIVDPAFTGLSTNGTMYLYHDIDASNVVTNGTGTLAPIYQWGGTPSVVNGQFTYNIQEMKGYIGNGTTAPAGYRVYVGEVAVAAGVVSAIIWYALMGRYNSGFFAVATATTYNKLSNIGGPVTARKISLLYRQNSSYVARLLVNAYNDAGLSYGAAIALVDRNTVRVRTGSGGVAGLTGDLSSTIGSNDGATIASGEYLITDDRGW